MKRLVHVRKRSAMLLIQYSQTSRIKHEYKPLKKKRQERHAKKSAQKEKCC